MKILLVDDHQIVRDGLRVYLEKNAGYVVIGEASDGAEAVRLARELEPDAIVMDIEMGGLNGIEAAREILAAVQPRAKIVCLSMHADPACIGEAFRAGAVGYLLKSSAFQELTLALQIVAEGQIYLSPGVAQTVVDAYVRNPVPAPPDPLMLFTPRERQILQRLGAGRSAKEIGQDLNISHKTVHAFRSQIMAKVGVDSPAELVKYAVRHGVVPFPERPGPEPSTI